jgi:hypothetical protein
MQSVTAWASVKVPIFRASLAAFYRRILYYEMLPTSRLEYKQAYKKGSLGEVVSSLSLYHLSCISDPYTSFLS